MKKGQTFIAEKATLKENNGTERVVYIQERGSVVSSVSKHTNSSWKNQEDVQTSKLSKFDDDNDNYSSFTNDDNYPQYSTVHYNDEGECIGGVLRSE